MFAGHVHEPEKERKWDVVLRSAFPGIAMRIEMATRLSFNERSLEKCSFAPIVINREEILWYYESVREILFWRRIETRLLNILTQSINDMKISGRN